MSILVDVIISSLVGPVPTITALLAEQLLRKNAESVDSVSEIADTEIDYVEFNVKFIKDGITVETDWTNATDIAVGESRKVEFSLVPDEFDSYEVTATSNPLD